LNSADPLARFRDRLSLPLIAAPMFLVSGVDLVAAACCNGVIGAFPTVNCRSSEQLDSWLSDIEDR
jgi:nitronate monooxygenase